MTTNQKIGIFQNRYKNAFAQIDVHRISGVEKYSLTAWRAGGREGMPESELVPRFWNHFSQINPRPRIVTFNGRGYGLALLRYRAMAMGLTIRRYFEENYAHRYSPQLHFDVMDQLCEHGATAWPSLEDVRSLIYGPEEPQPDMTEAQKAVHDAGTIAVAYGSMRLMSGHTDTASFEALVNAMGAPKT